MNRRSRSLLALLAVSLSNCVGGNRPTQSAGDSTPAPGISAAAGAARPVTPSGAMIFLLIGQSNMVGAPAPEPADELEVPRVSVLAYDDCPRLGRTYNHWYPARPPLHGCDSGVGPGDYFGRALAKAHPGATIGLVPLAINGVDIDLFVKGVVSKRRGEFRIPPDNQAAGAYEWVVERAKLAQQSGTVRGILFHQGESDTGSPLWVGKVKQLVSDLRTDLGLGDAPFVAGELLYSGCCGKLHNPLLAEVPRAITNAAVVSADGLAGQDTAHFNLAAQRELGSRYAEAMRGLLD
jgi:hypothetical protein